MTDDKKIAEVEKTLFGAQVGDRVNFICEDISPPMWQGALVVGVYMQGVHVESKSGVQGFMAHDEYEICQGEAT